MHIPKDMLLRMYERMQLIRTFENRVKVEFGRGKIPGFVHLYAGEEAVVVGICAHLSDADYLSSTHRGHGHYIAQGVDVRSMMAELFGKATGTYKPFDEETVLASVKKTGRLVIVDESHPRCSMATDIAALVADRGFDFLNGPIKMVTAPHTPVPFSPTLEDHYLPSPQKIMDAALSLF